MKITHNLLIIVLLFAFSGPTFAQENDDDYNKKLLDFTAELEAFAHHARDMQKSESDKQKEKYFKLLRLDGARVAALYFSEADEDNKKKIYRYLSDYMFDNKDIKNHFTLLGNSFVSHAEYLINLRLKKEKKVRRLWLIGGTVVGIAVGGTYLYLKVGRAAQSAIGASTRHYLIAASAIALGAGVGYFGGRTHANYLPVDRSLSNAKEFEARYPQGEDFIEDIDEMPRDLALGLLELEGE